MLPSNHISEFFDHQFLQKETVNVLDLRKRKLLEQRIFGKEYCCCLGVPIHAVLPRLVKEIWSFWGWYETINTEWKIN